MSGMIRRYKDIRKLALKYCDDVELTPSGVGHIRVRLTGVEGRTRVVFAASSGSDYRGILNLERDLRHAAIRIGTHT